MIYRGDGGTRTRDFLLAKHGLGDAVDQRFCTAAAGHGAVSSGEVEETQSPPLRSLTRYTFGTPQTASREVRHLKFFGERELADPAGSQLQTAMPCSRDSRCAF